MPKALSKVLVIVGSTRPGRAADLAWWSAAPQNARAAGELVPGTLRARAAAATKS